MSGTIILVLRLIGTMALFGFLGWALFFLYREVNQQGRSLATRRVPGISLTIRHGEGASTLKYFSQPEIIFGRDPGCDIPLTDETISTRHARLNYHHNQWWLEDLESTNGTALNGTQVSMPTVITSGDEITCGTTRLTVSLSGNIINEPTQKNR